MPRPLTRGQIQALKMQMYADGHGPWCLTGPCLSAEEWAKQELAKLAEYELEIAEAKCAVIAEILLTPGDNLREKIERLHQQFKRELLECLKSAAQVDRIP